MQQIDLVKDSTLQDIAVSLRKMANVNAEVASLKDVQRIVRAGNGQEAFPIGDQINLEWTDITTETKYLMPFDVQHFTDVELANGSTKPGMILKSHYSTPFGIQFSNYQAFYYAPDGMPAGTYNVVMGENWGAHVVSGKTYQFTLTQPVPAGGQLAGFRGAPDQAPSNWRVYSYASNSAKDPIETVVVTEGASGSNLGTFTRRGNEAVNSLDMVAYGNNTYYESAIRQWLNSDKGVGEWWTPQGNYDRCPDQLAQKAGFLTGFNEDVLAALTATKIVTKDNNFTTVANEGFVENVYDKVFIPSLEEMYINPQVSGEGVAWDYWKEAARRSGKFAQYGTYPELIHYSVGNHKSAQYIRLRSAVRGRGYYAWVVYTSGYVYYGSSDAVYASACTPAIVIC